MTGGLYFSGKPLAWGGRINLQVIMTPSNCRNFERIGAAGVGLMRSK
jgi:hypothetical protein